jgi:hypothetical protein
LVNVLGPGNLDDCSVGRGKLNCALSSRNLERLAVMHLPLGFSVKSFLEWALVTRSDNSDALLLRVRCAKGEEKDERWEELHWRDALLAGAVLHKQPLQVDLGMLSHHMVTISLRVTVHRPLRFTTWKVRM